MTWVFAAFAPCGRRVSFCWCASAAHSARLSDDIVALNRSSDDVFRTLSRCISSSHSSVQHSFEKFQVFLGRMLTS